MDDRKEAIFRADFAPRLLAWYEANRRSLPWRERHDPWATWVSEIMLQQTRVEAVLDAFERFMSLFPEPAALAGADDDSLLRAWQGLGYYRRARLLRDGARAVVERHGGVVPDDPDALEALPGIGRYTRGAIASIAFGRPEPAIDGNVERVFARFAGIDEDIKKAAGRRQVEALVRRHLDPERAGDFNQALMDLGATVCTPRGARCEDCPLAADCRALAEDRVDELPRRPQRRAMVDVAAKAVLIRDGNGRVLAHRIEEGQINQGQLELPGPGLLVDHPEGGDKLAASLARRFGIKVRVLAKIGEIRHSITHHRIRLELHEARLSGDPGSALQWVDPADSACPWSTASRKALRSIR